MERKLDRQQREQWILALEDASQVGGISLPEWCNVLIFETDTCFLAGADISTIIVATAAIEIYLRSELDAKKSERLVTLASKGSLPMRLASDVDRLRRIRNAWVHLSYAQGDDDLSCYTSAYTEDLEREAYFACRVLREVIFSDQFISRTL